MFLTSVLVVAVLHATRHDSHTIIKECNIVVHSDYILNKYNSLYELRLNSDDPSGIRCCFAHLLTRSRTRNLVSF